MADARVSAGDQSIEAQRHQIGRDFDREFSHEKLSGSALAANGPSLAKLLEQLRPGDKLYVYAVDRLGRDALDVRSTVRRLPEAGVSVHIDGLGLIVRRVGRSSSRSSLKSRISSSGGSGRAQPRAALRLALSWRPQNRANIRDTALRFGAGVAPRIHPRSGPSTCLRFVQIIAGWNISRTRPLFAKAAAEIWCPAADDPPVRTMSYCVRRKAYGAPTPLWLKARMPRGVAWHA
ncbi:recombinase family protein [Phenylobacterium sp. LjRoot225]|uniref:recombinase family protein n=1 Tax=Phenylobacterium sp. LjRoot225 TaxID=3342285 RepID=UPI003F50CFD3